MDFKPLVTLLAIVNPLCAPLRVALGVVDAKVKAKPCQVKQVPQAINQLEGKS